jgi:hypothetical protein
MEEDAIVGLRPREESTPYDGAVACLSALDQLYSSWLGISPDDENRGYIHVVFGRMLQDESTDGDKLFAEHCVDVDSGSEVTLVDALVRMAAISCAYCVQSLKAMHAGDEINAWRFLADANYWRGVTVGMWTSKQFLASSALKEMSRKGADKTNAENRALRAFALEHYEKHRASFSSVEAAAQAIAGKIVPVAHRTVRDWIASHNKSKRSAGTP